MLSVKNAFFLCNFGMKRWYVVGDSCQRMMLAGGCCSLLLYNKNFNGFVDRYGFLCSFICFCKMVAVFYSTVMTPSLPTFSFPFFAGLGVFSIFMKLGMVCVFFCLAVFGFFVWFVAIELCLFFAIFCLCAVV